MSLTPLLGMKNSLKLITFDATGTLLRFRKPPVEIYMDFAKKHGIETKEKEMKGAFREQWKLMNQTQPHFGPCWKSWWTQFVVNTYKGSGVTDVNDSILSSVASELIAHFRTSDCWDSKPGAVELLSQLEAYKSSEKIHIGVISNFDPRLREILKNVGILHFFDFLILSHEQQISKPSKEIFHLAMANLKNSSKKSKETKDKILGGQCLHIGDNYELDYLGGISAGWNATLIIPQEDKLKNQRLSRLPPNSVFESLHDLRKYLFQS